MLRITVKSIFEKVIDEPHFSEIYARLCWMIADKEKKLPWNFMHYAFDLNAESTSCWWLLDVESDQTVMGPYRSAQECCETFITRPDEVPQREASEEPLKLVGLRMAQETPEGPSLLKIYETLTPHERDDGTPSGPDYYFWFQPLSEFESDAPEDAMPFYGGPLNSEEEARKSCLKKWQFKKILLNTCQEEFERKDIYGGIQAKYDSIDIKGMSTEKFETLKEDRRMELHKAKKRMLGNIRFIGELYKRDMLGPRVIHPCIMRLLGVRCRDDDGNEFVRKVNGNDEFYIAPDPNVTIDDDSTESLCKLLTTIGRRLLALSSSCRLFVLLTGTGTDTDPPHQGKNLRPREDGRTTATSFFRSTSRS